MLRDLFGTLVLGQTPPDLRLNLLPELLKTRLELIAPHPFFERRQVAFHVPHQAAQHGGHVDDPEHAVLEVRAAGALALNTAEPGDCLAREVAERLRVPR